MKTKAQIDLWAVCLRGGPRKDNFEIAVLRVSNSQGIASYGWFDEDKLLITQDGGDECKLSKLIWSKLVRLAKEVAQEMNSREFGVTKKPKVTRGGE